MAPCWSSLEWPRSALRQASFVLFPKAVEPTEMERRTEGQADYLTRYDRWERYMCHEAADLGYDWTAANAARQLFVEACSDYYLAHGEDFSPNPLRAAEIMGTA